jgi:glycogen debranching enzyme
MKRFLRILFLFLFLTIDNNGVDAQMRSDSLIIFLTGITQNKDKESDSIHHFLDQYFQGKFISVPCDSLPMNLSLIRRASVIWIHKNDSFPLNPSLKDPGVLKEIRQKYETGGSVLLTQDAVDLLVDLGLEDDRPGVQYRQATDEGYGRKFGLHAYHEHPIFSGLSGGSYLSGPDKDTTLRIRGYFGHEIPDKGRVLAVEWYYITLLESSKLAWEYNLGKGKVICMGAFTSFSSKNIFRKHLMKVMSNTLLYLKGNQFNEKNKCWDYGRVEVTSGSPKDIPFEQAVPSHQWNTINRNLQMSSRFASGDYFDLAGKRIVLMGKENAGIDEIWVHPFMALRDYRAGIRFANNKDILWLDTVRPSIVINPECIVRTYSFRRAYLKEVITVSPDKAIAVIHYEYRGISPAQLYCKWGSNLRQMWPYSENTTGSLVYRYEKDKPLFTWEDIRNNFSCMAGFNKNPLIIHQGNFEGFCQQDSTVAPVMKDKHKLSCLAAFDMRANDNIDLVLAASSEGYDVLSALYDDAVKDPENIYQSSVDHYKQLFNNKLVLSGSDPAFTEGYLWALAATDRFFVTTPGVGTSLVAGYGTTARGWDGGQSVNGRPGYAWYFGRDAQWSGFAVTGYGDFSGVREVLNQFIRYQDISGKIYHELTTSGVVHYDAADATPLFIALAGRYIRQSGDTAWLRENWPAVQKSIQYCFSTDTDADHLIENTHVGHGWVEGGKLFPVHTEIYLAGCWADALNNAAYLAEALKQPQEASLYQQESGIVKDIINKEFWNERNQFFSFGRFKDKTYLEEPTVLPAVPILFGLTDSLKSATVLRKYAGNEYSTNWGMRILRDESPWFNPRGYHYGSVWPLFTGWTSLAEYKCNKPYNGYQHMMNNLLGYLDGGKGLVEEVLNGAEYEPSGVCSHQCWSETMVLQPAIEGLLGLKPDAVNNILDLDPQVPPHWDWFKAENIKIADHNLNVIMKKEGNRYVWTFIHRGNKQLLIRFRPSFPEGTVVTDCEYYTRPGNPFKKNYNLYTGINFPCRDTVYCAFEVNGGISVIPEVPVPQPGSTAEGLRIIDTKLTGNKYMIELQAAPGSRHSFQVYINGASPVMPQNAKLTYKIGPLFTFETTFPPSGERYVTRTVTIPLVKE